MTSKEFVLANTEKAFLRGECVHIKYRDMKRTFKVFEPKEIMYSSPGNHYTQVVMVRPYKLTKDQEQRAWAAAARRVR